jgi:hypothetical protein
MPVETSSFTFTIFYKPYPAASQNLLYKNRKTAMRFFSARFLGIFSLLAFLKMPKNRPPFRKALRQFHAKNGQP